jgi:hypothetical protein
MHIRRKRAIDMTDNKIDLNKPVTAAEIQERLKDLTPEQIAQARAQQIDQAILNPKGEDKAPNFAGMTDGELRAYTMKHFGF